MEFSRPEYWSGSPFLSPGHLPNPGIKPRSPILRVDSFPAQPPGKSRNTGVGSLFLVLGIFLTQESNQGLLHCRRILFQLSYGEALKGLYIFHRKPVLLEKYWKDLWINWKTKNKYLVLDELKCQFRAKWTQISCFHWMLSFSFCWNTSHVAYYQKTIECSMIVSD